MGPPKVKKKKPVKRRQAMPRGAHAGKFTTVPGSAHLALENGNRLLQAVSYAERIDIGVGGPSTMCIYVHHGWCFVDSSGSSEHMFEAEYKSNVPVSFVVGEATKTLRRCYCSECASPDENDTDKARRVATELQIRANIARVNQIPLDGTESNEARIDALVKET